jgi:hypothetical protein
MNDTAIVVVADHFAPSQAGPKHGRTEQIIFSNETITSAAELNSLM